MNKVEIKNLTYTYGKGTPFEKTAVDSVSAEFHAGEFIGIIGHTGSGKSTLVQHLNALLKPTDGDVLLDGESIFQSAKHSKKVRQRVGLVFQYPEYQLFEETLQKDIAFGPKNMGLSEKEINEAVLLSLSFVGLAPEILSANPFELSGGQKRRVAIAGVISMRPEVLILDEPTAGLDPEGRDDILKHIKEYHEATGGVVILVSHSMEDIAKYSDKVLVMNSGKIEMFEKVDKVFDNSKRLMEIGLEVPQVTRIILSLKEKGYELGGAITVSKAADMVFDLLKRRGKA